MVTASVLIGLGLLTQIIVIFTTRSIPRFTKECITCGNHLPLMERPPAIYDCPECERLMDLGADLNDLNPTT